MDSYQEPFGNGLYRLSKEISFEFFSVCIDPKRVFVSEQESIKVTS